MSRVSRPDWVVLGLMTLVIVIFFAPLWLKGGWIPAGGGDLIAFMWPNYRFASRMLRSGHLPLWNPHYDSGIPFWADNQMAVAYPFNLIVTILTDTPYEALEALVIFHVWLAGAIMYASLRLLLRENPIRPPAAAVGAFAWMLSDIFILQLGHVNIVAAAAWLPLIFVGTWRALQESSWRWALVGAAALALNTLAGHGQITYFAALLAISVSLWWIIVHLIASPRRALQTAGLAALIGVAALALSAVGWLPLLTLLPYTERAAMGYELASFGSIALDDLKALFSLSPGDRALVGYIGTLALILAGVGVAAGMVERRKRGAVTLFLVILAILALLMALGGNFPLHRLAYAYMPGISAFRIPSRFITLFSFSAAILAALGLNAIRWEAVRWIGTALVAAELVFQGIGLNVQYGDPRLGYMHTDIVEWLRERPGAPSSPYRIDNQDERWQPNTAMFWGAPLYDIHGYFNPLSLTHYEAFYWSVGARGTPLYNFLGAKYVIAGGPPGDANFVPAFTSDSGLTVYLNLGALPLVHLVYEAIPVTSMEDGWNLVHRNDWDAGGLVYVENGPAMSETRPPDARVSILAYEPNRLVYQVSTSKPAYLVLSEVDFPGWRATIDGELVPIYRANLAFRAILIEEPGEHTVRVVYRPVGVYTGIAISAAVWLAVIAAPIIAARRRNNQAADRIVE
jgi:hypothetical protein